MSGRGGCYCPLTWFLVHGAGIHATIAGVLLGFAVPVIRRSEGPGRICAAEEADHDADGVPDVYVTDTSPEPNAGA